MSVSLPFLGYLFGFLGLDKAPRQGNRPMELTSSFVDLLPQFSPVFTAPTYQTFVAIVAGWVLSQRHRFITEVIFSSGHVGHGHWSRFHRFFSHAAWDLDTLSLFLASRPPTSSCWVKPAELDSSIRSSESPLHLDAPLVPLFLPRRHLSFQLLPRLDPTRQALPGQHRQLDLRHVQPAAMLRGVVDLQLLGDPPGPLRRERLVQRRQLVRVQVVHHQHHFLRLLVHLLDQPTHHLGEVHRRPTLGHLHRPPTEQRFADHEQVGRPVAGILVVEPLRLARLGRDRLGHLADQLLARLVEADQGALLVVGPVVDFQHVLHRADELGVGLRRDAPLLPQPGLDLVFFRASRTVSSEIESTTSNSTSLSASNRMVHTARPSGGAEQARAINRASARPSSFTSRTGRSRRLRSKAASRPSSTKRWRTRSTVATLTSKASAIWWSGQAGPPSAASALSRIRAWVSFRAAA